MAPADFHPMLEQSASPKLHRHGSAAMFKSNRKETCLPSRTAELSLTNTAHHPSTHHCSLLHRQPYRGSEANPRAEPRKKKGACLATKRRRMTSVRATHPPNAAVRAAQPEIKPMAARSAGASLGFVSRVQQHAHAVGCRANARAWGSLPIEDSESSGRRFLCVDCSRYAHACRF